MIFVYFITRSAQGVLSELTDLLNVELKGDDLRAFESKSRSRCFWILCITNSLRSRRREQRCSYCTYNTTYDEVNCKVIPSCRTWLQNTWMKKPRKSTLPQSERLQDKGTRGTLVRGRGDSKPGHRYPWVTKGSCSRGGNLQLHARWCKNKKRESARGGSDREIAHAGSQHQPQDISKPERILWRAGPSRLDSSSKSVSKRKCDKTKLCAWHVCDVAFGEACSSFWLLRRARVSTQSWRCGLFGQRSECHQRTQVQRRCTSRSSCCFRVSSLGFLSFSRA